LTFASDAHSRLDCSDAKPKPPGAAKAILVSTWHKIQQMQVVLVSPATVAAGANIGRNTGPR
jgi:hypothetical protein